MRCPLAAVPAGRQTARSNNISRGNGADGAKVASQINCAEAIVGDGNEAPDSFGEKRRITQERITRMMVATAGHSLGGAAPTAAAVAVTL